MPRALKICACLGCRHHDRGCLELVPAGRCTPCTFAAEQARGTAQQRGYGHRHRNVFRTGVLNKHPLCVCTDPTQTATHHHGGQCLSPSTVADHHPLSRRELEAAGLDPDNPRHGRGLCKPCHDHHTSQAQPGGWNGR